jgi:hypothetical protein
MWLCTMLRAFEELRRDFDQTHSCWVAPRHSWRPGGTKDLSREFAIQRRRVGPRAPITPGAGDIPEQQLKGPG